MSSGSLAIWGFIVLATGTTLAAVAADVRRDGWRPALTRLAALVATLAAFSALVLLVARS